MMQKNCDNCKNHNAEDPFTKVCTDCRWVYENGKRVPDNWEPKVRTMADRIRAMSDEELAEWLAKTQISNVKEALEIAGIPYKTPKGMKEEVKAEALLWLKKLVED